MIVRLLDIGVDPILGGMMDRTRTRWGRYKPWLIGGVPVIVLGVSFLLFARPGVGPLYLLTWLLVSYLGYSIIVLSQLALTAAQTKHYNERAQVFGWWQASYTIGIVLVVGLPMLLGAHNNRTAIMQSMGAFILLMTPLCVAFTCLGMRDVGGAPAQAHKAGLREYFQLFRRRSTATLMTVDLLFGLATGVVSALGLFFFVHVKQIGVSGFGVQMLVSFSTAIVAAPLWTKVAMRVGKHRALALGRGGVADLLCRCRGGA